MLRFIEAQHVGGQTVELRRKTKPAGRVRIWTLRTAENGIPTHTQSPAESPADIVMRIVNAANDHALEHGAGQYQIVWQHAKKATGPSPSPEIHNFSLGGDVRATDEREADKLAAARYDKLWEQHMRLIGSVTALIEKNVAVVHSLAEAWGTLHTQRAETSERSLELEALRSSERRESERIALAKSAMAPLLAAFKGRIPTPPAAPSPDMQPTTTTARPSHLARAARSLVLNLDDKQVTALDGAAAFGLCAAMESASTDADVCALVARIAELDASMILDAMGHLTPEQIDAFSLIQEKAVEAAARAAAQGGAS